MCGIVGCYTLQGQVNVRPILESLFHRGPDNQKFVFQDNFFLGHTRLSILDTSDAASQPFRFQNLIVVFNGEIYNYKEIGKELKAKGYSLDTSSDTEVLIKAFHCWGTPAVHKFIGMFAFALYNSDDKELFLFRDRVGIKPLYYSSSKGEFYFGSEMKAFYHFPISKTINISSVAEYFRFGYVSGKSTIFNEIHKVPPGHYLHYKNGDYQIIRYWDVQENTSKIEDFRPEGEWLKELEETMISAFKYRMVSDVPVGVFLSGGIDSSLVASILQKHYGNIKTFTIGFSESAFDESAYARKVASYLKTDHVEQILSLEEARECLLNFYDIYDEPFADSSGVPTALVASLARKNGVKVVLSADGGDELFGGYNHYLSHVRYFKRFNKIPPFLKDKFADTLSILFPESSRKNFLGRNLEHRAYALEELLRTSSVKGFYEGMLANQARGEINNLVLGDAFQEVDGGIRNSQLELAEQMMLWDFSHYLPDDLLVKVDRATMFHNIEGRDPFLDHRLVSLAYSMPLNLKIRNGKGKYALRKILGKYVPEVYFERPKMGFSIPLFDWFAKELDMLFEKYLSEEMVSTLGFLNYAEIEKEKRKYEYNKARGHQHNIEKMWRLLSFMMWWDKWGKNA